MKKSKSNNGDSQKKRSSQKARCFGALEVTHGQLAPFDEVHTTSFLDIYCHYVPILYRF